MDEVTYLITGRVVDAKSKNGIPNLRIEAWDKDMLVDDLLGVDTTGVDGRFSMKFDTSFFSEFFLDRHPDIYFKIFSGDLEVYSTKDDVIWNYEQSEDELLIEADFSDRMPKPPIVILNERYIVSGYVRNTDSVPVQGVNIEAFDRKVGKLTPLGASVTNEEGYYQIDYADKVEKGQLSQDIDLLVKGSRPGWGSTIQSDIYYSAAKILRVNLVVSTQQFSSPCEYEKMSNLLAGQLEDSSYDLEPEDIRYLAVKLTIRPEKVERFAHANKLKIQANKYQPDSIVTAEVFYGLMSDEDIPGLEELTNRKTEELRRALQESIKRNAVSQSLSEILEDIISVLKDIAVKIATQNETGLDAFSLKNLVRIPGDIPEDVQDQFIDCYVRNEEDDRDFWEKISGVKQYEKFSKTLQELFALAELTQQNMLLISQLYAPGKRIEDFASWEVEQWEALLENKNIPLPVGDRQEIETNKEYALRLAYWFKKRFPMTDMVAGMEKFAAKSGNLEAIATLKKFIKQYPDYELGKGPIKEFLASKGAKDKVIDESLVAEVGRIQLAYCLAPAGVKKETTVALLSLEIKERSQTEDGHWHTHSRPWRSMGDIVVMGRAELTSQLQKIRAEQGFSDRSKIAGEADSIYRQVIGIANRFNMGVLALAGAEQQCTVISPMAKGRVAEAYGVDLGAGAANLTNLFSTKNQCECGHCRSIYSPGNYLAELWSILPESEKEHVIAVRPDIYNLQLSCANTNTKLPYIDLVNEQLERMLIVPERGDWKIQTSHSEEELLLRPEHEASGAYYELAVRAYPFNLPWDKWFDEARRFMDYLGVPLYRLCEIMLPAMSANGRFTYQNYRKAQLESAQVVRAHLGITQPFYTLLTKTIPNGSYRPAGSVAANYLGLDNLQQAESLPDLLHALGLGGDDADSENGKKDFIQFRQILACEYIQNSRAGNNQPITIDFEGRPCDQQGKVRNLTDETLYRLSKFEHLRKVLGWTPGELQQAINIFRTNGATNSSAEIIDEKLLACISGVLRLKERWPSISNMEMLSLWGTMNTGSGCLPMGPYYEEEQELKQGSLYERIYLDEALFSGHDQDTGAGIIREKFVLDEDKTELAYITNQATSNPSLIALIEFSSTVSSALKLSQDEFLSLAEHVRVHHYNAQPVLSMNLSTLSTLYRIVSLTKHLGLKVKELTYLYEIIREQVNPFESPADTILFVEYVEQIESSPFSIADLAYILRHHIESDHELDNVEERRQNFRDKLITELHMLCDQDKSKPGLDTTLINSLAAVLLTELASYLSLSVDQTKALIETVIDKKSGEIASSWAKESFDSNAANMDQHLARLEKATLLVRGWGLRESEIRYLGETPASFNGFRFSEIPIEIQTGASVTFQKWLSVDTYVNVRNKLEKKEDDLIRLYDLAWREKRFVPGDVNKSITPVIEQLRTLLGLPLISITELQTILVHLGMIVTNPLPPRPIPQPKLEDVLTLNGFALTNAETLIPIVNLIKAMRSVGVSFDQLKKWVAEERGKRALDSAFPKNAQIKPGSASAELARYKSEVVEEIRNTTKARSSEVTWKKIGKGLQDRMRESQRTHLVMALLNPPVGYELKYDSIAVLQNHLLIDPLMQPCMLTTRLKQAISSLQLLVHSALTRYKGNPGHANELAVLGEQWDYLKNYRVWEAQQKVLAYPENWLLPELRDNKTPFFKEFEDELLQSEIDDQTIERAYKNYLRKLDIVGNLEVASFTVNEGERHVVGRTRELPRVYYYRKQRAIDGSTEEIALGGIWEPWERIDLDIDSEVVLITIHAGTPYIFWPTVKERVQKLGQDNPDDPNDERRNYRPVLEISFNWSRYEEGQWSTRKRTEHHAELMYEWDYKDQLGDVAKYIEYDIELPLGVEPMGSLKINMSILSAGCVEHCWYSWDEGKLDKKFDSAYLVVDEIDWSQLEIDIGSSGFKQWLASALEPVKQSARQLLFSGDPSNGIQNEYENLNSALYQISKLAGSWDLNVKYWGDHYGLQGYYANFDVLDLYNTHWRLGNWWVAIEVVSYQLVYILLRQPAFHKNNWKNANELPNGYGLTWGYWGDGEDYGKLKKFVVEAWPEGLADRKSFMKLIDLEIRTFRSMLLSQSGESDARRSRRFASMDFAGYRLSEKVFNGTGLLSTEKSVSDEVTRRVDYNLIALVPSSYDVGDYLRTRTQNELLLRPSNNVYEIVRDEDEPDKLYFDFTIGLSRFGTKFVRVRDNPDTNDNSWKNLYMQDKRHCHLVVAKEFSKPTFSSTAKIPYYHADTSLWNNILHDKNVARANERFRDLLGLTRQTREARALTFSRKIQGSGVDVYDPEREEPGDYQALGPGVEFGFNQAFGAYNWEIFFHMPLTVAMRLSENRRFEKAQEWFHYIFNPLRPISPGNDQEVNPTSVFWNFLPLRNLGRPDQIDLEDFEAIKAEVANDPFQPHRIARFRPRAYQWMVVMKYLDNLIAWGDELFERDTIESINEACHRYSLAATILGPRPKLVPRNQVTSGVDTGTLSSQPAIANLAMYFVASNDASFVGQLSNYQMLQVAGAVWLNTGGQTETISANIGIENYSLPAFCIPCNEKLLHYWNVIADRLLKIRNCRNKEGLQRDLPIYEPPIDPMLLVRGRAMGLDINDLLSDLYAPLPSYRFRFILQKAYEYCADVRNMGGMLLSALEKKDAEELSLLRSGHEKETLSRIREIKLLQINELNENLNANRISLNLAKQRAGYYKSRPRENVYEKKQTNLIYATLVNEANSQQLSIAATIMYMLPQIQAGTPPSSTQGGMNIGSSIESSARMLSYFTSLLSQQANLSSLQGSHERRMDDWKFQASQADLEIKQIERQILATEIRVNIAEKELSNHERQQEQAEEIETFLQDKFTSQELYNWMASQISSVYFQSYSMASNMAKMAQKCYQLETGEEAVSFIEAGHWSNLKKGLMSGEKLQLDLRRMEEDYLRKNDRQMEISKNISLNLLDPVALDTLRVTGSCTFHIPELLFDLDYPGHYFRRIKSLSVSIPSIVGPYSDVNCTLTLGKNSIRIKPSYDAVQEDTKGGDKQVTISTSQNGSGLFELNHNDERYLPFELRGVDSEWTLELSPFAQFDWSTISDVIFHLKYTAKQDNSFKDSVIEKINTILAEPAKYIGPTGLAQRFDIRREYPEQWGSFIGQVKNKQHEFVLNLSKKNFPYLWRPSVVTIEMVGLTMFCAYEGELNRIEIDINDGKREVITPYPLQSAWSVKKVYKLGEIPISGSIGSSDQSIVLKIDETSFEAKKLKEMVFIVRYNVTNSNFV